MAWGRDLKMAIESQGLITHPEDPDLGFLYGVIFSGPPSDPSNDYRNVCVFADGEVDRSPTGTGVSGRLAIDVARGRISRGESLNIESIIGSVFRATYLDDSVVGGRPAVIPEVTGSAHIIGSSKLWIDPHDRLGSGFLIR